MAQEHLNDNSLHQGREENSPPVDNQDGSLDNPQSEPGEARPTLFDRMQARQSTLRTSHPADVGSEEVVEETGGKKPARSRDSIMRRRWRKFKSLKRGYYSFILLIVLYVLSFFLPLFVNNMPLMVTYNGETYFPAFADLVGSPYYPWEMFGRTGDESFVNFHELKEQIENDPTSENSILMPLYTWDPLEGDYVEGVPPTKPSSRHVLGTDATGRDVLARILYGFNISISFGLLMTLITFLLGTFFGALMGYFGGKFDLVVQRGIEVWHPKPL